MDRNSPAFKRLRAKWYKKLKDEGFEDIESPDSELLHKWHGSLFATHYDPVVTPAKEEYYRRAAQELHTYPFENNLDRLIWEKHAGGLSIRDIVKLLKKRRFKQTFSRQKVHTILKRLAKDMGLAWKKV